MADKKKSVEEPEVVVAEQGGSTELLDYSYEVADGAVAPEPAPEPK